MRAILTPTRAGCHGLRRGTVIPLVAASLTVLLGFAALAIDVGRVYDARAELQRTADASAMAAAAELGSSGEGDPLARAKVAATDYAARNEVMNEPLLLDPAADIVFGSASVSPVTGKFVFTAGGPFPNAVRVTARRATGSPSGAVPVLFANILGIESTNVAAAATAVLVPRDIVFVLDLSSSHNDDSSLVHYRLTDVHLREVWASLWDAGLAEQPTEGDLPAGPYFGNMNTYGTAVTGPGWDYASDPGLVRLKRGAAWNLTADYVSQTLNAKGYGTYTAAEMSVINSCTGAGTETSTTNSTQKANYRRRVRVALGIDRWKSGKPGGQAGGNGDNVIDAGEVVNMIPYPSSTSNPTTKSKKIGGSWDGFIDYVSDISKADTITSDTGLSYVFLKYLPSSSYYGNPDLRWRFGLKTLVDYAQDVYEDVGSSPGLTGSPEEPMLSVTTGVQASIDIIQGLEGSDLIGTAAYGTYGYGPADKSSYLNYLTDDMDAVRARVGSMQAGMWTSSTNIAQGIDKGVDVLLNSPNARSHAAKYMILLTDGKANQTRANPPTTNETQARLDTLAAATEARNNHAQKIRIYCVSVGADADISLMDQVAQIGGGEHFHASGDIAEYRQQLQEIFKNLGGRRPVALVD